MLARRPNRRDAGIHIRRKALSALNRIRIPLYKKYGYKLYIERAIFFSVRNRDMKEK